MPDLHALIEALGRPGDGGWTGFALAFVQVVLIDLVLAGDNAVAVGLAASRLQAHERRKVIFWGLVAAVVLRIGFALITIQLLQIIGLLLAGGFLLLTVCWRMWLELDHDRRARSRAAVALDRAAGATPEGKDIAAAGAEPTRPLHFWSAFLQILAADLSMSLDNVLAVAGAARRHPAVLVAGLLLSVALMGVAATVIARVLHRWRWIAYIGLLVILVVALRMIWEGGRQVLESGMIDPWLDRLAVACGCKPAH